MKKHMTAAFYYFSLLGLLLFSSSSAFASGISEAEAQSIAAAGITPGIYEIAAADDTGFVLDISTCTLEETDSCKLQMFRSLDVNQQKFYVESLPGSGFRISALRSGKALTADTNCNDSGKEEAKNTADGAISLKDLERSAGASAPDQQTWYLESCGDGSYYLLSGSRLSSSSKTESIIEDAANTVSGNGSVPAYLTRTGIALCNGEDLELTPFTGKKNQRWILKKAWISSQDTAHTDYINPFSEYGPYENVRLLMRFGDEKEVLTSETLAGWISEESHCTDLDSSAVLSYAQKLAEKYDTQGYARKFRTSYGKEITLYKGNFGWKLDAEATALSIMESACFHRQQFVAPVWKHKGVGFTRGDDIGDSYVEIDLVNQKVWLYQNGEQLLATECVSGTYGTDRQTPGGVYSITYKQSPAVLRGPGYESPVTYWMPFNGGIGLHDASWRDSFGGDIFKTNGSHGCINLPTEAAKLIYETVSAGYPVVCYN